MQLTLCAYYLRNEKWLTRNKSDHRESSKATDYAYANKTTEDQS